MAMSSEVHSQLSKRNTIAIGGYLEVQENIGGSTASVVLRHQLSFVSSCLGLCIRRDRVGLDLLFFSKLNIDPNRSYMSGEGSIFGYPINNKINKRTEETNDLQ